MKAVEYLRSIGLLIRDIGIPRRAFHHPPFQPVRDISVIIPTLNESKHLSGALESLKGQHGLMETIVVDGGSSDGTQEEAKTPGVFVIEGERGRGLQINAGIPWCSGDVILILHADCRLESGLLERVLEALNRNPHVIGGAVGMRYLTTAFKYRFVALLNNLRARWTGIAFGDQCQFFRKESLELIGGFPDQMLMEDVELSMRMKETGFTCYIPRGVTVSHRRWDEVGFRHNITRVVTLCLKYLIQRRLKPGDDKKEDFYRRYYAKH